MTSLLYLMISVSLLSVLAESVYAKKNELQARYSKLNSNAGKKKGSTFLVFIVTVILSLFSGLRTSHNDTYAYIRGFINNIPASFDYIDQIYFSIWDYTGFFIYQVLIKQYISTDPQVFLLISAFITNILHVFLYFKYSPKFSLTIYIFITSGLFVFGMAAVKQMLAMSIGVWAIHYALKGKWSIFALLLLIASTFHPYIFLYGLTPIFINGLWTFRELSLLLIALFGALYFESFLLFVMDAHALAGEDLSYDLLMGEGVNIYRVLVYTVTPVLALIFRKKLRAIKNPMLNVSVNFSIMSFVFMLISLFGNPSLMTRIAIYFDPFAHLALTHIIMNCFPKDQRLAVIAICVISYSVYFYYQFAIAQPFIYRSILGTFY